MANDQQITNSLVIRQPQSNVNPALPAGSVQDVHVANGIQYTKLKGVTPGSIPFAGTLGLLAENNTNFYFDPVNLKMGIGTNAPTGVLEVKSTSASNVLRVNHTGSASASAGNGAITVGDIATPNNSTSIYMRTANEAGFSTQIGGYFNFYPNANSTPTLTISNGSLGVAGVINSGGINITDPVEPGGYFLNMHSSTQGTGMMIQNTGTLSSHACSSYPAFFPAGSNNGATQYLSIGGFGFDAPGGFVSGIARAGTNYLMSQNGSNFSIGTYDTVPLNLITNNVKAMSIDSAQIVTLSSLIGGSSRTVSASATGALSASASDSSLKQEVFDTNLPGLSEVLMLKPKAFKWLVDIENRGDDAAVEVGFFANDIAPVIPSAAPIGADGLYGLNDRSLIAAVVNAIKELNTKYNELQEKLDLLVQRT